MSIDYARDLLIDETALDLEWLNQASLAMKYGRHFADCARLCRKAEENKKVIRSGLIRQANLHPMECCQKPKPTGADIEAYYRTHSDYIEAVEDLIEAEYEKTMAEIAKNEMCFTRKAALENLVTLHGQQYFAGPAVPRNLAKEKELANVRDQRTVTATSKKMKRKNG